MASFSLFTTVRTSEKLTTMLRSIVVAGCVAAASAFAPMSALPKAGTRAGENPSGMRAARRQHWNADIMQCVERKGRIGLDPYVRILDQVRGVAVREDGCRFCKTEQRVQQDL